MKTKKLMAVILAGAVMASLLCGCTGTLENKSTSTTEESTMEINEELVHVNKGEMHGYTATELISQMKTGWNLGNSLDSLGGGETAWGNPATTRAMIDMIKKGGFDILRVPVTWGHHMDENNIVDADFMARVTEVVNYGIGNEMYVILEIHHEPDSWLKPQSESMDEVKLGFDALWKQIAENFADYGDRLIFESMNEPRVKGIPEEWTGGTEDGRSCVNKLNKSFVRIVRASGGNNTERILLITTYAQAVTKNAIEGLELIDDKYVGVSLHTYIPYSFTYHSGESYETFVWDGKEEKTVNSVFRLIDKCIVSKGVPVVITEYGAEFKLVDGEYNTGEICKWAQYFLGKAKELSIPCVIWDNNERTTSKIPFGIYNRDECVWHCDDIRKAIMSVYE